MGILAVLYVSIKERVVSLLFVPPRYFKLKTN